MDQPDKSKGSGFDYARPSLHKLLNGRSGRFVKSATISHVGLVPIAHAAENLLKIAVFPQAQEGTVNSWFTNPEVAGRQGLIWHRTMTDMALLRR